MADREPPAIPLGFIVGAVRQFVHDPETCQRLPELILLPGALLSYAATARAIPVGFWDRRSQPTPGRLRRLSARMPPRKSVRDGPSP